LKTTGTILLILLLALGTTSLAQSSPVQEIPVQEIVLLGAAADAEQQYSGMEWYGDTLVLLPQYPDDALFGIEKSTLLTAIAGEISAIEPFLIPFDDSGFVVIASQGYEAIAFTGDQVYLTIEAGLFAGMHSYLVQGTVLADRSISIHGAEPVEIAQPARINNAAHEAITIIDGQILSLYERNGQHESDLPAAELFSPELTARTVPLPALPYRITDATTSDADGRFYVINYLYPGETAQDADDPFPISSDLTTHSQYRHIERLVELQLTPDGSVQLTDALPVYLQLEADPRNWEGIVRLDDLGFLLITDSHPDSILAFVPYSQK
jgi:hypothetical protein